MFDEPVYGAQTLLVKPVEDLTGAFPNGFRKTYKCLVCSIRVPSLDAVEDKINFSTQATEGLDVVIVDGEEDRAVMCCNFRRNKIIMNAYYLAYLVGDYYVLDNQAAFLENL